jgi:cytochrome P450
MSLPDGPKSPKIWQMLQWITMPFSFMRGCSDRYGDRFTLSFFSRKLPPVVFFSNPQALQVILTSDDSELFDSPGDLNALLEPLIGTESVMGLSGDRHRRMRQLLMPSFHGERMRSYGQVIRDITEEVMSQRGAGESFPVRKSMRRYFNSEIDDPSLYDVTLNTGRLGFARTAEAIAQMASQHRQALVQNSAE